METPEIRVLIFDIATYALGGFFACFFFVMWYLRKNEDPDAEIKDSYSFWAVLLFRYRDFTRNRFGKVHFMYYLTLFFLALITLLFVIGFILHLQTLEAPLKYIVGIIGAAILSLVVAMFNHVSKNTYYEQK